MTPIDLDLVVDLDLVELRCKLRGWKCERFTEDGADYVSVECRYGGEFVLGADGWVGRESGWDTPAHKRIEALLTAPRWTLDRLLSEPPEGWRVLRESHSHDHRRRGRLAWGRDLGIAHREVVAEVVVFSTDVFCVPQIAPAEGPTELARLAERLKAAAELALILAEVEP